MVRIREESIIATGRLGGDEVHREVVAGGQTSNVDPEGGGAPAEPVPELNRGAIRVAGRPVLLTDFGYGVDTALATGAGYQYFVAFFAWDNWVFSGLRFFTGAAAAAGVLGNAAIYTFDAALAKGVGPKLAQGSEVALDVAATARTSVLGSNFTCEKGKAYWVGFHASAAASIRGGQPEFRPYGVDDNGQLRGGMQTAIAYSATQQATPNNISISVSSLVNNYAMAFQGILA